MIDPVRRIDIVAKTVVVQELVCTADVTDFGAVVIRIAGKCIDLAFPGRRVQTNHLVGLVLRLRHRRGTAIEGKRGGELTVTLVDQLVDKAVCVGEVALQHLFHEGLGVGHVFQAIRLRCITIKAIVFHEVVDGLHLADVGFVIGGLSRYVLLLFDPRQGLLEIARDVAVTEIR